MKSQEDDALQISKGQTLNITLLASEWKSSAGGLSTVNRELAIHLSEMQNVRVSLLVPEGACNEEDVREADDFKISILIARKCMGLDPLVWLTCPPQDHTIDVIVGHNVKLGCQVQLIKRHTQFQNCKWVHVVHTDPEELGKHKDYCSPISRGEKKHWNEVDLCKEADLVVPVGPKLAEIYHSSLQECKKDEDFFKFIPGLFEREFKDLPAKQNPKDEKDDFLVLLYGRSDEEDFQLKGYDIAAKAFADQRLMGKHYVLLFVGSPEEKQDDLRKRLLEYGITDKQLRVREFVKSRKRMKELFCEVDMVIMPSRSEGFGLAALEALSAGLPILVGSNSGFARAIEDLPCGSHSIVYSEDPAKWAKKIEKVRVRHRVVLQENRTLQESYRKEYCWTRQCKELVNKLWKMVYGMNVSCSVYKSETDDEEKGLVVDENKENVRKIGGMNVSCNVYKSETGDEEKAVKNKEHVRKIGETLVKLIMTSLGLKDEKEKYVYKMLHSQVQAYAAFQTHSTDEQKGVGAMTEAIIQNYEQFLKHHGLNGLSDNHFQLPVIIKDSSASVE